jgi:hypothetical protein
MNFKHYNKHQTIPLLFLFDNIISEKYILRVFDPVVGSINIMLLLKKYIAKKKKSNHGL